MGLWEKAQDCCTLNTLISDHLAKGEVCVRVRVRVRYLKRTFFVLVNPPNLHRRQKSYLCARAHTHTHTHTQTQLETDHSRRTEKPLVSAVLGHETAPRFRAANQRYPQIQPRSLLPHFYSLF